MFLPGRALTRCKVTTWPAALKLRVDRVDISTFFLYFPAPGSMSVIYGTREHDGRAMPHPDYPSPG